MINVYNEILNFFKLTYIKVALIIATIAIIGILVFKFGTIIGKALYYLGF